LRWRRGFGPWRRLGGGGLVANGRWPMAKPEKAGGVHVATGFVGVGPWGARRKVANGWIVPGAEMAKHLFHNPRVINHGDDAPACAAPFRPADAGPTPAGGPAGRRHASCCCTSHSSEPSGRPCPGPACRQAGMLGDGGQEVGGGEDLEVAVDLGIEPGAVDDQVAGLRFGAGMEPVMRTAPGRLRRVGVMRSMGRMEV
jgi:hypothetical protein